MNKIRVIFSKIIKILGNKLIDLSNYIIRVESKLIKVGGDRCLYRLPLDYKLWLNNTGYIDLQIKRNGAFEPVTTKAISSLIKPGDVVIDVGANIGYYTILFSKLVGASGCVYAFEPTNHFRSILQKNISENNLKNVRVVDIGLSDEKKKLQIDIGPSSATLHSPAGFDKVISHEEILLSTLNDFCSEETIERIDFIKVDIDGHEPLFFNGAWQAIEKYSPTIIFEVSHLHYLQAGVAAWDFYDDVKSKGYKIYYEENFHEVESRESFLRNCANFAYSSNVIISKNLRVPV